MNSLLVAYSLLFLFLAWKNFRWAIFLFIVLLPTYLIRFELFNIGIYPFPSTLLEVTFGILFLVWLIRYSREDVKRIIAISKKHKWFFMAFDLFFLSSVVSIFVSDMVFFSLGEWRAYFLEPIVFFLILLGRMSSPPFQGGVRGGLPSSATTISNNLGTSLSLPLGKREMTNLDLMWALSFSTLSIGVFSIIQKFTGWGIATPEWVNEATRRVTAFFTSPNAVGLYLAPILMLMMAVIVKKTPPFIPPLVGEGMPIESSFPRSQVPPLQGEEWKEGFRKLFRQPAFIFLLVSTLLVILSLAFTKSQGAWIAVGAGILVLLFFIGYKKITIGLAIAGIILSLIVPSIRAGVLFKDQAGKNRLRLWGYSWTFLKESPKNFVLGTGVRQFFRKIQKPYYDKYVMERLIYPHNIFLNFWTETGLLGMLAMVFILGYATYLSNKIRQHSKIIGAGLLAMLTTLVVHGLVDVPYFKNDLAFLFWILIATVFVSYAHLYQGQANGARK